MKPFTSCLSTRKSAEPIWAQLWFYGIIFAILLVVGTVVQMTAKRKSQEQIFWYTGGMLSSLGLLFVVVSLIIADFQRIKNERYNRLIQFLKQTETDWIKFNDIWRRDKDLLRLFKSIYSSNTVLQSLPDPPFTPQVVRKEQAVALQIFQIIENVNEFVTQEPLGWSNPDMQTWLTAFREWFKSSILLEAYRQFKQFYAAKTRSFIEACVLSPLE